ncbi:MAG: hypothetical protein L6Q99_11795 [Planctomycetes bacterium]|nr:hypothetical protein [Planctomycetota bacterium]
MKKSSRILLIVALSPVLCCGGWFGCATLFFGPDAWSDERPPPDAALVAGVRVGAELYEQRELPLADSTGFVTDLALARAPNDPTECLIVVGTRGYEYRDRTTLEFLAAGPFGIQVDGLRAIDLDGDGRVEFATLGGHFSGPVVFDGAGEQRPLELADGPVSPSTPLRVGWERSHFHVLGHDGRERRVALPLGSGWMDDGDLALADTDGDGSPEILTTEDDVLVVRELDGKQRRRFRPPDANYVNRVELRDDFGSPARELLVIGYRVYRGPREGQHYDLYELDLAKRVGELGETEFHERRARRAPLGEGRTVSADERVQQARIAGIDYTRQRICVRDPDGTVIFEDIVEPGNANTSRAACGDVLPLAEPAGAFVAGYGPRLRLYVPR